MVEERDLEGSLYHFSVAKTISCWELQHLLTEDIYKYICSIFTMEIYLQYRMILLFLFRSIYVLLLFFEEMYKCIMLNFRSMLVQPANSCHTVNFDVIIIMYVIYQFCVLSCSLSEFFLKFSRLSAQYHYLQVDAGINIIMLLIRIGYLGYMNGSFYLIYRNQIESDFLVCTLSSYFSILL